MMHLTRRGVIQRLRDHLLTLTDDQTSMCMVAARKGVFCRGFARFSDDQLRREFGWIADRRPQASREELEEVINLYRLARTESLGLRLACDAQTIDRDTCMGWDDFSDEQLVALHLEWLGAPVELLPASPARA